ncbi:MAG TPA: CoA-binding protein [Mucilaginibacter sp.]|nr:CoA-binding protein [Mucilaginibacter sp.]
MVKDWEQILKAAKTVLLVDWPNPSIPRSLVKAGLAVYGFSPGRYLKADVTANRPAEKEGISVFEPRTGEEGYLIFEKIEGSAVHVDIVCICRPEAEHERIFKNHLLSSGAKTIWLQPPVTSSAIQELATANGIKIIEGINIANTAAKI